MEQQTTSHLNSARATVGPHLRRSRSDRMLSGVCGGVAEQYGIDATLIRVGLVALTVLGFGAPAVIYVAAWILAPERD